MKELSVELVDFFQTDGGFGGGGVCRKGETVAVDATAGASEAAGGVPLCIPQT